MIEIIVQHILVPKTFESKIYAFQLDRVTDVSNYFQLMIYNMLAIWLAKTCLGIPLVKKFAKILTAFIQVDLGLFWEWHVVFL